jgi:NADH dehydrogenase
VLETRTVVWTGGIHITQLTQESGMTTGSMGRVVVDEYWRLVDFPFVYAIGDNALAINPQTGKPVPAAAQFALQQGRLVAENIFVDIFGGRKRAYSPKVWGRGCQPRAPSCCGMACPSVLQESGVRWLSR